MLMYDANCVVPVQDKNLGSPPLGESFIVAGSARRVYLDRREAERVVSYRNTLAQELDRNGAQIYLELHVLGKIFDVPLR